MYFISTSIVDGSKFIVRPFDQFISWIPMDESNADYQQYLAWIAEGNEPEEWKPE